MDGYHIYRKDLDEDGLKFRGAPFTFNKDKFKQDLQKLKKTNEGSFPSFEHSIKDPIED
jgi:pantothenate kinase